jgi:hypothetical protein
VAVPRCPRRSSAPSATSSWTTPHRSSPAKRYDQDKRNNSDGKKRKKEEKKEKHVELHHDEKEGREIPPQ